MSPRAGAAAWSTLAFCAAVVLIAIGALREAPCAAPARALDTADGAATPATTTAAARAATAPDDVETGRRILARHCGTCHTPGLPTSQAGALAIFSLADADWSAHMTPKQICVSGRRLHGTSHEPEEVRAYEDLIARLLAGRGAPPCSA